MSAVPTSWLSWIATRVSGHNPGLARRTGGSGRRRGFLAAALLGRVLATLFRIALIVMGILVAASVLRGGKVL